MINFAYEGLVKIACDCLQHDGHEVTNLISVDKRKRIKGFMADRFIKPPVSITLIFACNIDVTQIIVNPSVGSQRSAGIELSKIQRDASASRMASVDAKVGTNRLVFSRDPENEGMVKFCNEQVVSRVKEMTLKIYRTAASTLPALNSLEIWGKPSANVPVRVVKDINETWKKIAGPRQIGARIPQRSADDGQISKNDRDCRKIPVPRDMAIPDEFVDPISCEIMTIPMTLPSGNTVDISTLEKFYAAEAKQGRGRSDPFTGVLFAESNQPVVATALKSRLDRFLLEHSNDPKIRTLPRTLGRKAPSVVAHASSTKAPSSSALPDSSNGGVRTVDQLLRDCLDGLPSFLDSPDASAAKKSKTSCSKCAECVEKGANTYSFKLPCQHIICRQCLCILRQENSRRCPNCTDIFEFSSVERFCQ